MKPKTARRWLARNQWRMASALVEHGIGKPQGLWKRYWDCLAQTSILFHRFTVSPFLDKCLDFKPLD